MESSRLWASGRGVERRPGRRERSTEYEDLDGRTGGGEGPFCGKDHAGFAGLVAAVIALPCGIVVLALILDWPVAEVSMAACLIGVALALFFARQIGRKVHQYCTVFCQDDEGRLFAVDIRKFVGYQRGLPGFIQMLFQMQKAKTKMKKDYILERYLRQRPSLTAWRPRSYLWRGCGLRETACV